MSKNSLPSLKKQVCDELNKKFENGKGKSKHEDKIKGLTKDRIYSYSTLKTYKNVDINFVKYCKEKYGCKTLKQCRRYINEYLKSRFHLSASTIKMEASALAKLYNCSSKDFIETPVRRRADIKRSRYPAKRDKHFSEKNNANYVKFCRSVGGRRKEMSMLRGSDLVLINGQYYIHFHRGTKGGKERFSPIIGDKDLVVALMLCAGDEKVFKKIPSNADTHSYRADYAKALYNMLARPIDKIPFDKYDKKTGYIYQSDVFVCRKDKKGVRYDRNAMLHVSRALGHNRVSVIASNYLY